MKPNVFFARMDSDPAQAILFRQRNDHRVGNDPDVNHAANAAVPISADYDIAELHMSDPLTALASLATWSENTATADDLQDNLGLLVNTPFDEITPTVLTKGLIRQMVVNRGALEKEAAAKAAERGAEADRKEHHVELNPEQAERRQRRRDRNKAAATRCRQRRREHIIELEETVDHLTAAQKDLEKQVAALLKERQELEKMLARHSCTQPYLSESTTVYVPMETATVTAVSESYWESSDDSSDDSNEEN